MLARVSIAQQFCDGCDQHGGRGRLGHYRAAAACFRSVPVPAVQDEGNFALCKPSANDFSIAIPQSEIQNGGRQSIMLNPPEFAR